MEGWCLWNVPWKELNSKEDTKDLMVEIPIENFFFETCTLPRGWELAGSLSPKAINETLGKVWSAHQPKILWEFQGFRCHSAHFPTHDDRICKLWSPQLSYLETFEIILKSFLIQRKFDFIHGRMMLMERSMEGTKLERRHERSHGRDTDWKLFLWNLYPSTLPFSTTASLTAQRIRRDGQTGGIC